MACLLQKLPETLGKKGSPPLLGVLLKPRGEGPSRGVEGSGMEGLPLPGCWHSTSLALASPQAPGAEAAGLCSDESPGAGAKA